MVYPVVLSVVRAGALTETLGVSSCPVRSPYPGERAWRALFVFLFVSTKRFHYKKVVFVHFQEFVGS